MGVDTMTLAMEVGGFPSYARTVKDTKKSMQPSIVELPSPAQTGLPWVETPCEENEMISKAAGCHIFTKLEYTQPSGSFKSRGIGNRLLQCVQQNIAMGKQSIIHFYSCSAGNAGLAAATAATLLGQQAIVVVPCTTTLLMRGLIEAAGARVIVHGSCIADCDELVRQLVQKDSAGVYVSPFDHPDIWEGNSTLVDELHRQFNGNAPDAIICSVGGGGLLNGILLGLERYGWDNTTVLAVETQGADSLSKSLLAGKIITLPKISSIAKSLGVSRISNKTWELINERNAKCIAQGRDSGSVKSVVLSDAEAAMACVRYTAAEGVVIEPACGVSVAGAYNGLFEREIPNFSKDSKIAIVVCGGKSPANHQTTLGENKTNSAPGSTVNLGDLTGYAAQYVDQISWTV